MAKKTPKNQPTTYDQERSEIEAITASLPEDADQLLKIASENLDAYHAACVAGDRDASRGARFVDEAIGWKLNGGTHHGCLCEDGGKTRLRKLMRAPGGQVPQWGQSGSFILTVEGMRVRCEVNGGDVALHAVDIEAPFLSPTGFRSCLNSLQIGQTVEDACRAVIGQVIGENGRPLIQSQYREGIEHPEWLAAALAAPATDHRAVYVEKSGQLAFAF